jgi:cystathionine beta-lyase family protein involved in aluminum resistance
VKRALAEAAGRFDIPARVVTAAGAALDDVAGAWERREAQALAVSAKVTAAFVRAGVNESHLAGSTGYAYHDHGRETYEAVLADVMDSRAALARMQLVSGTHAIAATLGALLARGGRLCSLTGRPYDTLRMAIVEHPSSLVRDGGVDYLEAAWTEGAQPREEDMHDALRRVPDVVFIQRSRGYATRPSLSVKQIGRLVETVREHAPGAVIVVDNCYGELVELEEPTAVGADVVVGSLIKNPGGGIAPTGAYVAGHPDIVARVADRVFAPGIGSAVGPTLDTLRWAFAGLHRAPRAVAESLKTLDFAAALFARLGFDVDPPAGAPRTDIIQAIRIGDAERLTAFARGLQRLLPVNSRATPQPGPVPGYAQPVIMAGGAFIGGATSELSCDAPLREPYEVYLQGGLDVGHGILAVMSAAASVVA